MNDTQPDTPQPTETGPAHRATPDAISPDEMMGDFRGKPIVLILIFTVIVHAIFIGVFSIGYIKRQVLGEDTSELTDEERMDLAVSETTDSLLEIAERYDVSLNALKSRFAGGPGSSSSTPDTSAPPPPADDRERSEYEENLEQEAAGPTTPELGEGLPGEGENNNLPPLDEQENFFPE